MTKANIPYGYVETDIADDESSYGQLAKHYAAMFADEFVAHAKFALPWIGRGFYLAIGFMFAITIAHKYVEYLLWR